MFTTPTLSHNNDRKIAAAVRQAIEEMQDGVASRVNIFAGGMPEISQSGEYASDGSWENYIGCGDDLDSGGCAP